MPRTHKSLPRLHVEPDLGRGAELTLGREQTNYLVAVLRQRPGDSVILFNGRDGAWRAEMADAGRKAARLTVLEQTAPQTPPSDLWFGFAPLKTGRLDYIVQNAGIRLHSSPKNWGRIRSAGGDPHAADEPGAPQLLRPPAA